VVASFPSEHSPPEGNSKFSFIFFLGGSDYHDYQEPPKTMNHSRHRDTEKSEGNGKPLRFSRF
jgi:hypothetical protein